MLLEVEAPAPPPPPPPAATPRPAYVEPESREGDDGPRRGFRMIWMVAALLIAVVGFGGWKGYQMMQGTTTTSGEVPLFMADTSPYKEVPDDPGGEEIPNTDILVLEGPITGEESETLEVLLPEPEEPMALEAETAGDADEGVIDVEASGVADIIDSVETDPLFSADEVTTFMDDVMTEAANAVPTGLPLPSDKPQPPEDPAETQTAVLEASGTASGAISFADVAAALEGGTIESSTSTSTDTVPEEGEEVAALSTPDTGGISRVQIAAYSSREAADAAWARHFNNEHDLLGDVDALIIEAVLGNATFYQLQVGAYDSPAGAEALCASLKQRDIDCLVVGP